MIFKVNIDKQFFNNNIVKNLPILEFEINRIIIIIILVESTICKQIIIYYKNINLKKARKINFLIVE